LSLDEVAPDEAAVENVGGPGGGKTGAGALA